jgi:hypothetical protein
MAYRRIRCFASHVEGPGQAPWSRPRSRRGVEDVEATRLGADPESGREPEASYVVRVVDVRGEEEESGSCDVLHLGTYNLGQRRPSSAPHVSRHSTQALGETVTSIVSQVIDRSSSFLASRLRVAIRWSAGQREGQRTRSRCQGSRSPRVDHLVTEQRSERHLLGPDLILRREQVGHPRRHVRLFGSHPLPLP